MVYSTGEIHVRPRPEDTRHIEAELLKFRVLTPNVPRRVMELF